MDKLCGWPWGMTLRTRPRGERRSGGRRCGRGHGMAAEDVASADVAVWRGERRATAVYITRQQDNCGSACVDIASREGHMEGRPGCGRADDCG